MSKIVKNSMFVLWEVNTKFSGRKIKIIKPNVARMSGFGTVNLFEVSGKYFGQKIVKQFWRHYFKEKTKFFI